jgi:hypothetical protein
MRRSSGELLDRGGRSLSDWIIRSAAGNGRSSAYPEEEMVLEIGIVLLSIVCFALLELYVTGCERV